MISMDSKEDSNIINLEEDPVTLEDALKMIENMKKQSSIERDNLKAKLEDERAKLEIVTSGLEKVSMRRLWNEGLPEVSFIKVVSDSSRTSTSNESIAADLIQLTDLTIDDLIIDSVNNKEEIPISSVSVYLTSYSDVKVQRFAHESDIMHIVKNLMVDILKLPDTKVKLLLLQEGSLSVSNEDQNIPRTIIRPDIWLVQEESGRPIAVMELKYPPTNKERQESSSASNKKRKKDKTHVLDKKYVHTQMLKYMRKIRSFYRQYDVIGILTSFTDWRICWFPYSDRFMKESIHTNPSDAEEYILNHDSEMKLHGTVLISPYNNPMFIKLLTSLVVKSCEAKVYPVPLMSYKRQYLVFSENSWRWSLLLDIQSNTNYNKLSLQLPASNTSHFVVLRYYNGGNYSKVMLSMSLSGRLGVIKQFVKKDDLLAENNNWKNINEVKVLQKKINNVDALIMPFVFTCVGKSNNNNNNNNNDNINNKYEFYFDMNKWCFEEGAIPDSGDYLDDINNQISAIVSNNNNELTPERVAREAITDLARKHYIHLDLHWRHIGLLPIVDDNNNIIRLKPILIDLTSIEKREITTTEEEDELIYKMCNELGLEVEVVETCS